MPTTPRKARILLESGRAEIYCRIPFTIKLFYKTGSSTQPLALGVDTGEQHIGLAVTAGHTVLHKTDIELRKSMEKRKLMATRQEYRRGRRYRKTRYRHPKFRFYTRRAYKEVPDRKGRHWQKLRNRTMIDRPEGWLPPSIQSKVDHHIRWISRYLAVLPAGTKLHIEVARFDVARMKDPQIHGELYQQGRLYDFENVKAYVLAKFNYTCPVCGHKFNGTHKPRLHHINMRKNGATDNPDEFAPVCECCHTAENHLPGGALEKLRAACKRKEYREPVFMNILRRRLFAAFPAAAFTYGNITAADRKALGLPKSHANDAVAIALQGSGAASVTNQENVLYIRQVRKKKRSLHEATPRKGRREPNRGAIRNAKNTKSASCQGTTFSLYDKVEANGQIGWITGFTGTAAYVKSWDGSYVKLPGKDYKQVPLKELTFIGHCGNWIMKTA